ncbi:MAG: helix-turn-helix transcriptional regulator [Nitrospirae bacterium]|nr:helix-turn-helix transcriptional regulator [Nitrospirota bacterium]
MSKAAFARELGVSPSYIGMLEEGKNEPSDTLSELICLKFNINKDWLLTGEGEPERKKDVVSESGIHYNRCSADPELSEIVDILQHDLPEAKKIILKLLKGRKEFKEGINALQTVDNNLLKEEEGT